MNVTLEQIMAKLERLEDNFDNRHKELSAKFESLNEGYKELSAKMENLEIDGRKTRRRIASLYTSLKTFEESKKDTFQSQIGERGIPTTPLELDINTVSPHSFEEADYWGPTYR